MRVGRLAAAETTARGQLGAEDLLVSLGKPEQEIQGTLPRHFREERLPTARFAARLRIIRFDGVACAFVYLVLNSSSSPFLRSPSHLYQVVMLYASHQRNCKKKRKHLSPRHLL